MCSNNVNFAMPFASKEVNEQIGPEEIFTRLGEVGEKYDPRGTFVYGYEA